MGVNSVARINRVQHIVLNCRDLEASVKFYTEMLGMEVVNRTEERKMVFLSFGVEHHNIALAQFPAAGDMLDPNHVGLNHIALELEGGEDQLKELYAKLQENGVHIDRLTDHKISRSVYFFDPDGNRLEVFCDMMPGTGKDWLHEHGGVADPLVLEGATSS